MLPVILETQRLILRPLTIGDAEAVFVWVSDPIVNRFLPYSLYHHIEEVHEWLKTADQTENKLLFGFERKEDHLLIGSGDISLDENTDGTWGFGYNLRHDCWNCGYATEATQAMIAYVREHRGARRIYATHAVDNPASGRVMEKCGLHFDHFCEYGKYDGSETFKAKYYMMDVR